MGGEWKLKGIITPLTVLLMDFGWEGTESKFGVYSIVPLLVITFNFFM